MTAGICRSISDSGQKNAALVSGRREGGCMTVGVVAVPIGSMSRMQAPGRRGRFDRHFRCRLIDHGNRDADPA